MAFSERQKIFALYLLERIGFSNETNMSNYLYNLEKVYGRYIQEFETFTYPNGYEGTRWWYRYSVSLCIDILLHEIHIKKNLGSIKLKDTSSITYISATDLGNYNFCPVSYCISKSFEIEHPTNEDKKNIGIHFHESLRLINKNISLKSQESNFIDSEVLNNNTLKKIKACKVIYVGHIDKKTYFKNEELKYVGQPDYIFEDPTGAYFVVEEKFKFKSTYKQEENNTFSFYENHLIQLQSYINFITEYKIEYGVLLYWLYDFNDSVPYIHSVKIKVIKRDEYLTVLNRTVFSLKEFITNRDRLFKPVQYTRCVSCVVNKYCAHKTNEITHLTMPYNRYIMKLKSVEFPDELRKPDNTEQI